jgi:putative DNA primase/helicase
LLQIETGWYSSPHANFRAAILSALGHAPEVIEAGRFQRFATSERRGDDAGWCRLFDDLRGGVFGCYRAGVSEVWQAERKWPMTREQRVHMARQVAAATAERQRAQRERWGANAQRNAELWAQCVPSVPRDPVTLYMEQRGLGGASPLPACLRYHPKLAYWQDGDKLGVFPAMVAPILSPEGRMVALHRTYLRSDGRKAGVRTTKKLTAAAGALAGACIRLHRPVHGILGVAEGIETALAASLASGVPTVAAYCAGALAGYVWPAGVRRLVIFADNDQAGRKAASNLQSRAVQAALRVQVMTPTDQGADWCDVWAQRGAVTVEGGAA